MNAAARPLRIALVAGETSGDQLGFKLMQALREELGGAVVFAGVGGEAMTREGLTSLFPMSDIAVMGVLPVLAKLPMLLRRIRETAAAILADPPDALVIIDSPDFTHRVAVRVRARAPRIPIIDYVSPSVWAWRPGRARAMRAYVDGVLALLPFEPAVHERLGGPPCVYVGHPLIERLAELRPSPEEAARREGRPPLVVVLPGSRRSEIARLGADFGAALGLLRERIGAFDLALPTLAHVEAEVRQRVVDWPVAPRVMTGEAEKFAAFRQARAALAASGTATLELALSGVPLVGAYKVSKFEEPLKYFVSAPSILLPNLILGARAMPEFVQADCSPARLADALAPLVAGGAARDAQLGELARLEALMRLSDGCTPSEHAARAVTEAIAAAAATT